jgi:signal-transduction protein with cAMP-binding, CBS, and nucleotidyltransferase domain
MVYTFMVAFLLFLFSISALLYNQKHKKFRFAGIPLMKTSNEVMTKTLVCCLPQDTVEKAAQLMKSGNIGSIPVIENEQTQKLVGIVTDRDLALKVVAEGQREQGPGDHLAGGCSDTH